MAQRAPFLFVACPALVIALGALPARADVPPPEGYEEQCTVEILESQTGHVCKSCGAYHGEVDKCDKEFAGTSFQRKCQTYGASVWDEVWCDPSQASERPKVAEQTSGSKEDPPKTGGGCRCHAPSSASPSTLLGALAGIIALGAAVSLRRRRR